MTAHIRIFLMSLCFALLIAPSLSAYAKDSAGCDSGDLVNRAVKRKIAFCTGCHLTYLGDKKDYVVFESVVSPWIVANQPVMNKKCLYVIQKSPRLIPVYPKKSDLKYDVQLPALTVTLIEHNENGYFRLSNLSGSVVFVHVLVDGKARELSICAGEEICLAPPDYPSGLLVPTDNIEREPISICFSNIPELNMAKSKIERKQLFERERLLTCERKLASNSLLKDARKAIAKARPLHPFTAVSQHSPGQP